MLKFLKKIVRSEKGQALPVVLILIALGELMVVPTLNFTATGLNSSRNIEERTKGLYAAEAGVEYALWCLENAILLPQQLPEPINQMSVSIQVEERGTYTVYFSELMQAGSHSNYLSIDTEIVWEEQAQAYKYTITVTRQPDCPVSIIHLKEVGARLPRWYSYESGSAACFPENLSMANPAETQDVNGYSLLSWSFNLPYPSVSESYPVKRQVFYTTGQGSHEDSYAWVVANREDIGAVGEIAGSLYIITATASRPESGEITGKIVADVVLTPAIYIASWQILK